MHAKDLARNFRTFHVMIPWGDDMAFINAAKQFENMDKIIKDVNDRETGVTLRYSTLSEYFSAVHSTASQVCRLTFTMDVLFLFLANHTHAPSENLLQRRLLFDFLYGPRTFSPTPITQTGIGQVIFLHLLLLLEKRISCQPKLDFNNCIRAL